MCPVISRTIFVQFLLIGVVLGMTLVNLTSFQNLFRTVSSIIYLIGILLKTFPFCYQCDSLMKDCDNFVSLLAQSQWIDAEPRYKYRDTFMAGGIIPITMCSNFRVGLTEKLNNLFTTITQSLLTQMAKFAFSVITVRSVGIYLKICRQIL